MRPDEHRRKKNENYKRKHNIQGKKQEQEQPKHPQLGKKATKSKGPDLGTNADRYELESAEGYQVTGRDYSELLASSNTSHGVSASLSEGGEVAQSLDSLSLDISSIDKAVNCFSISTILQLDIVTGRLLTNVPIDDDLTDYVDDDMDQVYVVDHDKPNHQTPEEIYFMNTGQRLPDGHKKTDFSATGPSYSSVTKEVIYKTEVKLRESDIDPKAKESPGASLTVEGEDDLEDWLDSVLDD